MNERFSLELERSLRSSGWFPNRRVDDATVYNWCAAIQRQIGCRVFPTAWKILSEFGDLQVAHPHQSGSSGGELSIYVNPMAALSVTRTAEGWFCWEWLLNEILFPIASYAEGEMDIAVASSGRIYLFGYGHYFGGDTFEEMLERAIGKGQPATRLSLPDTQLRLQEAAYIYHALDDY